MFWQIVFPAIVIGIPLAGMATGTIQRWIKYKEKQLVVLNAATAERAARYAAQTERLEQRMRVLERIVTDRGIDVADEIERLCDKPLN